MLALLAYLTVLTYLVGAVLVAIWAHSDDRPRPLTLGLIWPASALWLLRLAALDTLAAWRLTIGHPADAAHGPLRTGHEYFPEHDKRLHGADITIDGEPAHWATSCLAGPDGWAARSPGTLGPSEVMRTGHVVVTMSNGAVIGRAA